MVVCSISFQRIFKTASEILIHRVMVSIFGSHAEGGVSSNHTVADYFFLLLFIYYFFLSFFFFFFFLNSVRVFMVTFLGWSTTSIIHFFRCAWLLLNFSIPLSHICRPRWLSWIRRPTGDQEVAGSTPAEVGNILSWRLIMKYFQRSFSPFRWFKKGSCQFLAKECAQYWLTA